MKTIIHHWSYNDGWSHTYILGKEDKRYDECLVGWHCWVYPPDNNKFEEWMKQNMTGEYEAIARFNSGDPMITVFIKSDEDATLFKLKWL